MDSDDDALKNLFTRVKPIDGQSYNFPNMNGGGKSWVWDMFLNSEKYKSQEQAYVDAACAGSNTAFMVWIDEAGEFKLESVALYPDPAVLADLTETECPWGGSPLAAPQEEHHGRPKKPPTP